MLGGHLDLTLDLLILLNQMLVLSNCERTRLLHSILLDKALKVFALFFSLKFSLLKLLQRDALLLLN